MTPLASVAIHRTGTCTPNAKQSMHAKSKSMIRGLLSALLFSVEGPFNLDVKSHDTHHSQDLQYEGGDAIPSRWNIPKRACKIQCAATGRSKSKIGYTSTAAAGVIPCPAVREKQQPESEIEIRKDYDLVHPAAPYRNTSTVQLEV